MQSKPPDSRTIVLVRHGETDWNRAGRLQGWAPVELSDRGKVQAQQLGEHLSERYSFDRAVASDLCRTRETMAILSEAGVSPEPTFDQQWRERDLGVFQGFTRQELENRFPAFTPGAGEAMLQEQPEGGERLLDTCNRVLTGWQRLLQAEETIPDRPADCRETILVVTHGGPILAILAHLKELDMLTTIAEHTVPNCSVTEIQIDQRTSIIRETEQVVLVDH